MVTSCARWVLSHQFFCQKLRELFIGSLDTVVVGKMFQKNKIINIVKPVAESAAADYNCKILTISFKKEKEGNVLRITIDGDKVTLDTCADISSKVSEWLDTHENNIPFSNYILEVTSPGPDRKLVTREDFEKFIDKTVLIITKNKAADGRKRYLGRIMCVSDDTVKIYVEKESAEFTLELNDISKTRLEYEC